MYLVIYFQENGKMSSAFVEGADPDACFSRITRHFDGQIRIITTKQVDIDYLYDGEPVKWVFLEPSKKGN